MKAIRQRVRVLPGGRIEITDPALQAGIEAEVVVLFPEPAGDGATAPPQSPRKAFTLVDLIGLAPSGRTAEEIDREIRDFRGDDEDRS